MACCSSYSFQSFTEQVFFSCPSDSSGPARVMFRSYTQLMSLLQEVLQGLGPGFKQNPLFDAQERARGKRGADLGAQVFTVNCAEPVVSRTGDESRAALWLALGMPAPEHCWQSWSCCGTFHGDSLPGVS